MFLDLTTTTLVEWSRWQFAMTAIYHYMFVPLTLGLALMLAIMETMWVKTGDQNWLNATKFWMKLFGINFAIGVATGLILEFQFGTNWSNYSWFVWVNLLIAVGEKRIAQKSSISFLAVSGLNSMPTGFCIQALATRIHKAEMFAPTNTIQVEIRWKRLLTLFQPKNMTATKVDSKKNAIIPSMASVALKISPTNQE